MLQSVMLAAVAAVCHATLETNLLVESALLHRCAQPMSTKLMHGQALRVYREDDMKAAVKQALAMHLAHC